MRYDKKTHKNLINIYAFAESEMEKKRKGQLKWI